MLIGMINLTLLETQKHYSTMLSVDYIFKFNPTQNPSISRFEHEWTCAIFKINGSFITSAQRHACTRKIKWKK